MRALATVALLFATASPAAAQTGPCELHVWPSAGMTAVRQRGFESTTSAGLINGMIKDAQQAAADKHDAQIGEAGTTADGLAALSTAHQIELLATMQLADQLALKGYTVILHDAPLPSRTIRTVKTRYAESSAPCYADLVLDDVVYSRAYANGRSLQSFFRFRDFADRAAPVRSFGTWVETRLQLFSIDPPVLTPPALDDLRAAYRANAVSFGALLNRKKP